MPEKKRKEWYRNGNYSPTPLGNPVIVERPTIIECAEDQKQLSHGCICSISILMRDGCQCGGE